MCLGSNPGLLALVRDSLPLQSIHGQPVTGQTSHNDSCIAMNPD